MIELLVVISIIVLLIAMLLPGIKRAKESARRITCASNLKQFNLALSSYAADNVDKLPRYRDDAADSPSSNFSIRIHWTNTLLGGDDSVDEFPRRRKLNDYNTNRKSFQCPSDVGAPAGFPLGSPWFGVTRFHKKTGSSYLYNGWWHGLNLSSSKRSLQDKGFGDIK